MDSLNSNGCRRRKTSNTTPPPEEEKIIVKICNCTDCGGKRQLGPCEIEYKTILIESKNFSF